MDYEKPSFCGPHREPEATFWDSVLDGLGRFDSAYDGCADLLKRELGVGPSVRTEQLQLVGLDRAVTVW